VGAVELVRICAQCRSRPVALGRTGSRRYCGTACTRNSFASKSGQKRSTSRTAEVLAEADQGLT
jgi:hypothetical protein